MRDRKSLDVARAKSTFRGCGGRLGFGSRDEASERSTPWWDLRYSWEITGIDRAAAESRRVSGGFAGRREASISCVVAGRYRAERRTGHPSKGCRADAREDGRFAGISQSLDSILALSRFDVRFGRNYLTCA